MGNEDNTNSGSTMNPETKSDSKEVALDVNLNEKPKNEPLVIDFKRGLDIGKMLQEKTDSEKVNNNSQGIGNGGPNSGNHISTPGVSNTNPETTRTVASELDKMKREESLMAEQFSVEDFEELAEVIIEVLDFFALFLLRAFSLDTKDEPYTVPVDRLKRMKKILTKILMKAQKKFPLGFLFFIAAIAVYGTPTRKAWQNRSAVLKKREEEEKAKAAEKKRLEDLEKLKVKVPAATAQPIVKQQPKNVPVQQPVTNQPPVGNQEPVPQETKKSFTINPSKAVQDQKGNQKPERKPIIPKKVPIVPIIPKTGGKLGA